MYSKDYYKILGVSATATLSEIKIAYRKLSKKFHPDINDGDKFFEEKFKEILEAYEILSNEEKRKNYNSTIYNNFKNDKYKNEQYQEFVRKRNDEFEKQKDDLRKWEESLKEKEKTLNSDQGSNRKFIYLVSTIGLIFIIFIIQFTLKKSEKKSSNKYPITLLDTDSISNYYQVISDFDTIAKGSQKTITEPVVSRINNPENELLNYNFLKKLDGNWSGKISQFNRKGSYDIRFICKSDKGEFKIIYPSLGCSGIWEIEKISNKLFNFKEKILLGKNACLDDVLVELKIINNKKLELYFYFPGTTTLNAKGIITKM